MIISSSNAVLVFLLASDSADWISLNYREGKPHKRKGRAQNHGLKVLIEEKAGECSPAFS